MPKLPSLLRKTECLNCAGTRCSESEWRPHTTSGQNIFAPDDYSPLYPTRLGGFPTELPESHYDIGVSKDAVPTINVVQADVGVSELFEQVGGR